MKTGIISIFVLLFVVVSVSTARAANLLANSSFEVCTVEKLPDFWGPGRLGISTPVWVLNTDSWRRHWGVDARNSHSGKRSLRIDCPGDAYDLCAFSRWVDQPKLSVPYTLSVWLKSDRADMPVSFGFLGTEKDVKVSKEWTRYWVTGSPYETPLTMIIHPMAKGVLWIDDVQYEQASEPTDYAPSGYDATLTEAAVHRIVPETKPFKYKPGKSTMSIVTIDPHRRFLVDGVPFIPYATSWEHLPNREILKHTVEAGFNSVFVYVSNDISLDSARKCLDDANSFGLKVICSMLGGITTENRTLFLTGLREHPALIAWNVCDEPVPNDPTPQPAYELAKKLDTAHPAYVNYAPSFYFPEVLPTDISSLDRYDIGSGGTPINQAEFTDQLEHIAIPAGKPSWIFLQSSGYAYWMSREPTAPEQEAMVYLTLIHGARGISFVFDKPLSAELWKGRKALAREIRELTPILYSLDPPPTVSATPATIHLVGKSYNGRRYIIAANTLATRVKAEINIPGSYKTATVLFENRKIKVENGVIRDAFLGYQRHVYVVH